MEAEFCKKPVISFTNKKYPTLINGKEILPPFLPNSRDTKELALLFDKIVNDIEFKNNLVGIQYEYIKKYVVQKL